MTSTTRRELLERLDELSDYHPEIRFGQLIANLATLAKGPEVEAIWEVEDQALLEAAQQQLAVFQAQRSEQA